MPPPAPAAAASEASILTPSETGTRNALLAELRDALTRLGIQAVLARRHRLVLRYTDSPVPPSGPTNPTLHAFAPSGTCAITTAGTTYRISAGQEFPANDPAAAAEAICRQLKSVGPPITTQQR